MQGTGEEDLSRTGQEEDGKEQAMKTRRLPLQAIVVRRGSATPVMSLERPVMESTFLTMSSADKRLEIVVRRGSTIPGRSLASSVMRPMFLT